MTALREFVKVKNHEVNIQLPNDFDHEEVEVIVIPKKEDDYEFWSDEEIDSIGKIGFVSSSFEDDEDELIAFSNHSANNIKEWLDDSEDEIWK